MIGQPVVRREDNALLRGEGRYTGDVTAADEAVLVFLRSDRPSGSIRRLDVAAALAMPGVLGVLTAADLAAERVAPFRPRMLPRTVGDAPVHVPPFTALADGAVRHVGEAVLALVAESEAAALDALEQVDLDIEDAAFTVDAEANGHAVWSSAPDNRVFLHEAGDAAAVDAAFAVAAHVVRQRLAISRVTTVTMEPRTCLAAWDASAGRYALRLGTQAPHGIAAGLALVLGTEPDRVRVISEQCGGSFGMRNTPSPEFVVALLAARRFGCPVRWTETRTEAFLADPQAREQVVDAALALDAEGRFLGLRVATTVALGAHIGPSTLHSAINNLGSLAGVYRTPAIHVTAEGRHINTQTVAPYRGAGRPEATYIVERLVDLAAAHLGRDRAALRRTNMIGPGDMPWRTPLTFTYDCGDFPALLDTALARADWAGFEARRAEALTRGRRRGIGIACPIEIAGGPVTGPAPEFARIELAPSGMVLRLGTGDAGQGHATTFLQVLEAALGLAPGTVQVVAGDTGAVARGTGTFGSRSAAAASEALGAAAAALRARLRVEAAEHLEAALDDIVFEDGAFRVIGTDRAVGTADLVAARGLVMAEERFVATAAPTFPNGCHVAEVEIDQETGAVAVLRYTVVDDVGTVINPLLVAGQIHGGVVQGLGQALMERIRYDAETGQLLTASFMDYAMPRAADVPGIVVETMPVPTAANALGVKGAGEAGTVGALPAVISAVADALGPLGIRHVDMPATSEAIWRAIAASPAGRA